MKGWHRQQAGIHHPHTGSRICHDDAPVDYHPLQAGGQVTIIHIATGTPLKCYPADARELVAGGGYVFEAE